MPAPGAAARPTRAEGVDARRFDRRGYPVVGTAAGYGAWAPSYDDTVAEGLDRPLLLRLKSIRLGKGRARRRPGLRHRPDRRLAAPGGSAPDRWRRYHAGNAVARQAARGA